MTEELRRDALDIFRAALSQMDARRAVRGFVSREENSLRVARAEYDLGDVVREVYVVALGKAAAGMAEAIDEVLADRITAGVVSAPANKNFNLSSAWKIFAGGHPVPNEASLEAGRAALDLLRCANHAGALVIFLVSGGGSAMMEAPLDSRITLDDLRAANKLLVTCGATIDEINFLRRGFSAVKGGGLSQRAPLARQVTLIISDTNPGDEHAVASGPSVAPIEETHDVAALLRDYDLERRLPPSILRVFAMARSDGAGRVIRDATGGEFSCVLVFSPRKINPLRYEFVLLYQQSLLHSSADHARRLGFDVTLAADLNEQPVELGAAELVRRLAELRRKADAGKSICLVSAGEFRCPVRGAGTGGRNSETVLRALLALEELKTRGEFDAERSIVILSAGTDGVDGNSPAAGAVCDTTTLARARERGIDVADYLRRSDSYNFFDQFGDAIITGATGTNVRDLRLLLAN